MLPQLAGRATSVTPPPPPARRTGPTPDAGYDALTRFTRLAAGLAAVVPAPRVRWKEPRVFFFDRRRQEQLESFRPPPAPASSELAERIAAELPGLFASAELRHTARGVGGLQAAAGALAPVCPAAAELAALLAVPDDEIVTVLHPAAGVGCRVAVRGVACVGQFHVLFTDALSRSFPTPVMPERVVAACRDANPTSAAGVPMVAEFRFQMHTAAALTAGGELPAGFAGSEHWLWPDAPLAAVPPVNGERVVLLGPPAFRLTWEVTRRFPATGAELRVVELLSPARVALGVRS